MRDAEATTEIYDQVNSLADRVEDSAKRTQSRIVMKNRAANRCEICKHSMIYTRKASQSVHVFCQKIERPVPPDIDACNGFVPLGQIELWDLAKMARLIDRPVEEGGHYL
jgi:hypothetical protein